ncbi:MAG: S-layer homology domain-containing protein [Clostridia bacterium]|nr:S-layer homology domain-containing protein [Clostridia bacterium]
MKRIVTLLLSLTLVVSTLFIQHISVSANGDNLAIGKPVTASSTHPSYKMEHINDGNLTTNWVRDDLEVGAYIQVDLGEPYRISSVVLHTRHDIDHEDYRRRMVLEFANTPDFSDKVRVDAIGETPTAFKAPVEIPITLKTPYRYVRAVKTDVFIFVLGEMEIYGELVDPDAIVLGDDVAGSKQESTITLLSYFGLMQPVSESIYGVDHLMTRAEAAQAVVDAFGGSAGGEMPFADVPKSHKNYDGVCAAYNSGYITGDGTAYFKPNDYVTKREIMYMTLRAIGYSDVINIFTRMNMNARLLKLVEDMDLFKDVSMESYDEPISRGDVATVFYNALLAPEYRVSVIEPDMVHYEKGEDLLRSRYNVVLTEGIVEENGISTLDGNEKNHDSNAVIGGKYFTDSKGVLDAYLGKSVIAASYIDSGEIFYAWQTDDNLEVVLPAAYLMSSAADILAGKIVAENTDGKEKSYSLAKDFYVIKNGVAEPYYKPSDLLIKNGQLRLVNNDGESGYDVVLIEEYTLHYLVSTFSDEEELTFVDTEGVRKTVKIENLSVTDMNGKTQAMRKVTKDSVVKLYSTPDGEHCRIILYNEPIFGKLSALSDTTAVIDNVKYSVSFGSNMESSDVKSGDAVIAYIDEAGEILWVNRDEEAASTNWEIAFSQTYGIEQLISTDIRFKLFTQDEKWEVYSVADKITVDGVTMKKAEFASALTRAAGQNIYDKELIRYKLNSNGELRAIDTIVLSDAEADDGITFSKMDTKITEGMFTKDSSAFWSKHLMISQAKADTPTFVLPVVAGSFTTDPDFDELYSMSTVLNVAGNRSNKTQNLQGYMPDEEGYPTVFVTTNSYSASAMAPTGGMLTTVTNTSAPQLVVQEVTKAMSADGDIVVQVKGLNLETQKEASFMAKEDLSIIETGLLYQEKPECLSNNSSSKNWVDMSAFIALSDAEKIKYAKPVTDIGFGDIIRYQTQGSTVRAAERIFDFDPSVEPVGGDAPMGDTWYTVGGNYPDYYHGYYRYQFGSISSATKNTLTITTIAGNRETYLKDAFAKVLVVEETGRGTTITAVSDAHQFAGVDRYKAMVYSNTGNPQVILVYAYE